MPRKLANPDGRIRMAAGSGDDPRASLAGHAETAEDLPYAVELWTLTRSQVERVLGRANSASLAQAIFAAAGSEHLGRKITLRHAGEVIAVRE